MIDMHTHSNASDGSFSPSELLEEAMNRGLYAFALTDHDTLSGLDELDRAAAGKGYSRAVPGVELSVQIEDHSIHVCGLFVDRSSVGLRNTLEWTRERRDARNAKIIRKFNELGYDIRMEDILNVAKGESVGRPHMAKILVEKGHFKNIQDVFDKLLKKGESAYVERELPSPEKAVSAIRDAGGIAIWAHPFARRNMDRRKFRETLSYMKGVGLQGIEAYYSTYDRPTQDYLLQVAREEEMLVSGGSDFHGDNMEGVSMGAGMGGLKVPDRVFDELLEAKGKCRQRQVCL